MHALSAELQVVHWESEHKMLGLLRGLLPRCRPVRTLPRDLRQLQRTQQRQLHRLPRHAPPRQQDLRAQLRSRRLPEPLEGRMLRVPQVLPAVHRPESVQLHQLLRTLPAHQRDPLRPLRNSRPRHDFDIEC